MRIKLKFQLISSALIGAPVLAVLFSLSWLPNRIPLHFDEDGKADQFGTQQEWMTSLLWSILLLNCMRLLFLRLVNREANLLDLQRVNLYLLSAVLVACASSLLIGQGIWGVSLYREWLPVLFFLFGSVFIYYGVPPDLPTIPQNKSLPDLPLVRQLANRQRIHTLTRLVTIRVNLLAVVLMLFVRGQDRWSVGILANLLVYIYLAGLSFYLNRHVDQG